MATAEVLDLRDYIQVLWRRRSWIVLTTLLVAGAMVGQALAESRTYQSIAKVRVLPAVVPGVEVAPSQIISMPDELEVATSATVADKARAELVRLGFTPGGIAVTNPTDTQTLEFAGYGPTPEAAQATAEEYADAYQATRRTSVLGPVTARLESVDRLIVAAQGDLADATADLATAESAGDDTEAIAAQTRITTLIQGIEVLQQEASALELAENAQVSQYLQQATRPEGPYSPRPLRSLILGLVLGFLLGLVLAFVRDRLDQRVESREDAELAAQAPVLGSIPKAPSLHRLIAVAQGGDPSAAEAFRALRTRVLFGASKDGFRTIMVTSTISGEGKTTTAANLAVALAQAESQVVLVSGDMHHPAMWRYLPERGLPGLADVLAGSARLSEVLVPTAYENLAFLPSGRLELVPEAALGSSDMLQTLRALSERADLIVIDAPPTLGVADTLDLASLVDGVVVTVDATQGRKDLVRDCVNELRSIGATVIGVVLTRVDPAQLTRYGYGYGYGRRGSSERSENGLEPAASGGPPAGGGRAIQSKRRAPTPTSASSSSARSAETRLAPSPPAAGDGRGAEQGRRSSADNGSGRDDDVPARRDTPPSSPYPLAGG